MDIDIIKNTFDYNPDNGMLFRKHSKHKRYIGWTSGTENGRGYMLVRIGNKKYPVHRIAWIITHGYKPDEIDHINHNKKDNRLLNLREVSREEQMLNRSMNTNNSTGVNGVSIENGKYKAYTNINKKRVHLGLYDTLEEASAARNASNILYKYHKNHGEKK